MPLMRIIAALLMSLLGMGQARPGVPCRIPAALCQVPGAIHQTSATLHQASTISHRMRQKPEKTGVSQGSVLLIGGGKTPPDAIKAFLRAAGGPDAPIVILAQTEENAVAGAPLSVALFREQGATQVEAPVNVSTMQIIALLERARGVWIPGGDQNRFVAAFPESGGVPAAIRAVYGRGGVVGGTSAGASLLGDQMPTGAQTEVSGLRAGAAPVTAALRVLPNTIIDQHFFARNHVMRLLTAVLENPKMRGMGLDEGAWATIHGDTLTVGDGQVMLLRNTGSARRQGNLLGTGGVSLRVLLPGERASLTK